VYKIRRLQISRAGVFAALALVFTPVCLAQAITVAAAADLQSAMQDIASRFQQETGKTVKLIYGSSGSFFQQIQNGAPFDMFFSANLDYPKKLEAAGLIETTSYYQYARGKIVVWVPGDSKINLNSGLLALLDPSIKENRCGQSATRPLWTGRCRSDAEGRCLRESKRQACARRKYLAGGFIRCVGLG
jgi:ABC-type molybdate transport system substrate-binding protein